MNLKLYLYNKLKRKTSSGNFIPEIDGLRFLAVMVVILYHIQLFFVAKTHSVYNYENVLYDLFNNGFNPLTFRTNNGSGLCKKDFKRFNASYVQL